MEPRAPSTFTNFLKGFHSSILVGMLILAAIPQSAHAQYYPKMHEAQAARPSQENSSLKIEDQHLSDYFTSHLFSVVQYMFIADPSQPRLFSNFKDRNDSDSEYGRFELEIENRKTSSQTNAYRQNDHQLIIAIFNFSAIDNPAVPDSFRNFNDDILVCTAWYSAGMNPQIVDLAAIGHGNMYSFYSMDVNSDGWLDLVCGCSYGAGSGGRVCLLTIQPDGMIAELGNNVEESDIPGKHLARYIDANLSSTFPYCSLIDVDGDGNWEIETRKFLVYGASAYTYLVLYRWNASSQQWEKCTDEFPGLYLEQQNFYSEFLASMQRFEVEPDSFREEESSDFPYEYSWQYKGEKLWMDRLDITPVKLELLLDSWDNYPDN